MKRDTARLSNKEYDLLIIGGGIYGAAAVWDAASRGLSVALVDKDDFGSKNSSKSQKTIHGGLRYIQHGDFKRMRESICERTNLMRIAPHLVHPMPCIIPTYGRIMPFIMPIALKVFDIASFDRNRLSDPQKHVPNGKTISKEECNRLIPGIQNEGLKGASIWYDSQAYNTERLVLSFIRSAEKAGADVANYLEVIGFPMDGNRVTGVKARDILDDYELEFQAKVVLNASGAWVDHILGLLKTPISHRIALAKMHLIVVNRVFVKDCAFGVKFKKEFKDGDAVINKGYRLLFISPWRNYSLIGTAQEQYRGDPEDLETTEDDIQRFIEEVNEAYPYAALTRKDVSFFYEGLIPIDKVNPDGDVKLSKKNKIYDHKKEGIEGLISIVSVKYTTARNVAQMITDMVFKKIGKKPPKCTTMNTPIYGGDIDLSFYLQEQEDDFYLKPEFLKWKSEMEKIGFEIGRLPSKIYGMEEAVRYVWKREGSKFPQKNWSSLSLYFPDTALKDNPILAYGDEFIFSPNIHLQGEISSEGSYTGGLRYDGPSLDLSIYGSWLEAQSRLKYGTSLNYDLGNSCSFGWSRVKENNDLCQRWDGYRTFG